METNIRKRLIGRSHYCKNNTPDHQNEKNHHMIANLVRKRDRVDHMEKEVNPILLIVIQKENLVVLREIITDLVRREEDQVIQEEDQVIRKEDRVILKAITQDLETPIGGTKNGKSS
ncbi:MAG: hypothetical protein ACTSVZ_13895 [Promethearchaeota archaeon]